MGKWAEAQFACGGNNVRTPARITTKFGWPALPIAIATNKLRLFFSIGYGKPLAPLQAAGVAVGPEQPGISLPPRVWRSLDRDL